MKAGLVSSSPAHAYMHAIHQKSVLGEKNPRGVFGEWESDLLKGRLSVVEVCESQVDFPLPQEVHGQSGGRVVAFTPGP